MQSGSRAPLLARATNARPIDRPVTPGRGDRRRITRITVEIILSAIPPNEARRIWKFGVSSVGNLTPFYDQPVIPTTNKRFDPFRPVPSIRFLFRFLFPNRATNLLWVRLYTAQCGKSVDIILAIRISYAPKSFGEESLMQALTLKSLVVCGVLMLGAAANAQQVAPTPPLPPTTPYGPPITLEQAKKVADAATAEANKRNMKMAIAIVEA